jgi:hypothetical protein
MLILQKTMVLQGQRCRAYIDSIRCSDGTGEELLEYRESLVVIYAEPLVLGIASRSTRTRKVVWLTHSDPID